MVNLSFEPVLNCLVFYLLGIFGSFLVFTTRDQIFFFDIQPSINFSEIENAKANLSAFWRQDVLPGHQSK